MPPETAEERKWNARNASKPFVSRWAFIDPPRKPVKPAEPHHYKMSTGMVLVLFPFAVLFAAVRGLFMVLGWLSCVIFLPVAALLILGLVLLAAQGVASWTQTAGPTGILVAIVFFALTSKRPNY